MNAHATPHNLQAETFPLWGSRLIEASAGTGKTWTIAALYLRLVLGHGQADSAFARALLPSEILVMTFTRAATRELSDRIRARLLEAARCFRGESAPAAADPFLQGLLADYPDEKARNKAAWQLAMAAESMDEASVHTIDAWCQRMLREHAFDSGSLFDEELVADEQALLTEAVQDYWRRECYPLSEQALGELLQVWRDEAALHQDMRDLLGQGDPAGGDPVSLQQVLAEGRAAVDAALAQLRAPWVERAQAMLGFVQAQSPPAKQGWNGKKFSIARLTGWIETLAAWASGESDSTLPDLKTGWDRLTPDGLQEMRASDAGPMPALPEAFEQFSQLKDELERLPQPGQAARRHAATHVARQLLLLKRRQGSFGFADMLERLDAALQGEHGERLRARILAQYPVALVDEFQDTSPLQYRIFDQIYRSADNDRARALLLIGDPKQSIYGFRGADIYSYLQARRATGNRHYALSVNYRSTRELVRTVNHCFLQAEQARESGAFQFKGPAGNPLPFVEVEAQGRAERWVGADGALPALMIQHDLVPRSTTAIRRFFAERCAEQIVGWLNDPDNGFERPDQPLQGLRPRDIAILVRTGKEAAAVRRALQRRGVASVYLSDQDSVYRSDEARDLVHWLRGVATPQDSGLARAALALALIGLPLPTLGRIAVDDEAFDAQAALLRELQQVWQSQGVLAMLRQSLHRFGLAARWLQDDGGERRLTNYLHLAELLQTASSELEGEQALIRWLMNRIAEGSGQNEEQVLRLESDSDLVKVITVHKSKGLEFPVVCLPYATSFRNFDSRFVKSAYLPREDGSRELVLDLNDAARVRYERERLREDMRLLYVALTRPRHALWMGFSAVKLYQGDGCYSHLSAAGYLVGGAEPRAAEDWLEPLQALADGCPGIELRTADKTVPVTRLHRPDDSSELLPAPHYQASFDLSWGIASYSRLTRDLKTPGATTGSSLSPIQRARPADDETAPVAEPSTASSPESDPLARPSGSLAPAPADAAIWHRFKRGPLTGNFLHDQLEWLAQERFALQDNDALAARLQARCERAGHEEQAPALVGWLRDVVHTRLAGPGVALAQLESFRSELEFWLPLDRMDTSRVDQVCRTHLLAGIARPQLQGSQLHGMLMGFADLVFEHEGRYWVLDYKSNWLGADDGAYGQDALVQAMAQHRYDVQAALYLLALHRLLASRLGSAYDPERQLGGAVYLFLRGIHGPAQGSCCLQPSLECLTALDAMLAPPLLATP
ncbi:MAG: exodeoxyribonuclease V subunit beta [Burkholderiales bacterium RIFOXYC12_FULL_65_23]|uniref:exodeoxyribonuclease V subunit beta n=1 Tax=Malikia spinosa TaxID=86180 RepID=UPI0008C25D90|nr:MAG: exodeoxyribonuclease V subunit beta [Burkholderiales bacterium RIFOXYC12_FULL_65_23]